MIDNVQLPELVTQSPDLTDLRGTVATLPENNDASAELITSNGKTFTRAQPDSAL